MSNARICEKNESWNYSDQHVQQKMTSNVQGREQNPSQKEPIEDQSYSSWQGIDELI